MSGWPGSETSRVRKVSAGREEGGGVPWVKGVPGKECEEVGEGCVPEIGACLHCRGCFRVAVGD